MLVCVKKTKVNPMTSAVDVPRLAEREGALPPPSNSQRVQNSLWNGLVVVSKFAYTAVAHTALFILLGIGAQLLFPALAPPFFALAGTSILTGLVVNILDLYDVAWINQLKGATQKFLTKYPWILVIGLVFGVAISALPWACGAVTVGFVCGTIVCGVLGVIHGIRLGSEVSLRLQSRTRAANAQPARV